LPFTFNLTNCDFLLATEDDKALMDLCHDLLRGAYEDVHKHPSIAKLLDLDDGMCRTMPLLPASCGLPVPIVPGLNVCTCAASGDKVKENVAAFIEAAASEDEKERRRELVLLSGVYALLVFVQANWTGAPLPSVLSIRALSGAQLLRATRLARAHSNASPTLWMDRA
jgi:hypothetical protein